MNRCGVSRSSFVRLDAKVSRGETALEQDPVAQRACVDHSGLGQIDDTCGDHTLSMLIARDDVQRDAGLPIGLMHRFDRLGIEAVEFVSWIVSRRHWLLPFLVLVADRASKRTMTR